MIKKLIITVFVVIMGVALYTNLKALSTGIVGLTPRMGNTEGCTCHGFSPATSVVLNFQGPDSVRRGDTAVYTISMSGGPLVRGGVNIAAGNGRLILHPSETLLQSLESMPGVFELTHVSPKAPVSGSVTWTFKYIAPASGTRDTLFSTGNSVNFTGGTSGDSWNFGNSKVIVLKAVTGIAGNNEIASGYSLSQNFPNPFNPATKLNYTVARTGLVNLSVYDSRGNMVKNLVNETRNAGSYSVEFNGSNLSSGVYYYKISVNGFSETKKMMLVK